MKKLKIILMFLLVLSSFTALADAGPKPSLEIIVKEMENDNYWLDLLVQDESQYSWLDISPEEKEKLAKLVEYRDSDGFHPALLGGTRLPLTGKLIGQALSDGSYSHKFGYVGTPELFKIAILTQEGDLLVSPQITRKHFQSKVIFDVSTLQGKEIIPVKSIFLEFNLRLLLTLTIELIIAFLFGFSLKKYWKILLGVNILTQVILNIGVISANLYGGLFMAIFIFVLMEIAITVFETGVYIKKLTDKSRARRISYGIIANALSLAAGFYLNIFSIL